MEFKRIIATKTIMKVPEEDINTIKKAINILAGWRIEAIFYELDQAIDKIDDLLCQFNDQNEIIIDEDETVKTGLWDIEGD